MIPSFVVWRNEPETIAFMREYRAVFVDRMLALSVPPDHNSLYERIQGCSAFILLPSDRYLSRGPIGQKLKRKNSL